MKSILTLSSILLTSVSLLSCRDNEQDDLVPTSQNPPVKEEQLPPITSNGANTFGCRVNGKVWVAKDKAGFPVYASIDRDNNYKITITGSQINGSEFYRLIAMGFFYLPKTEFYPLFLNDYKLGKYYGGTYIDLDSNKFWNTDSLVGGSIHINKLDTVYQVISGTFAFDCINPETHDTLHITDGRFDMNYLY